MSKRALFSTMTERVFRVGSECYIIFVGRTLADRREFIRIGNEPLLPPQFHAHIEALVLTDKPFGNPYYEKEFLSHLQEDTALLAFMGNPQTVLQYKRFFERSTLPFAKYQVLSGSARVADVHGAYVYFFQNNKLEVRLDENRFFSLDKRAIADTHYPTRVAEANALLQRMSRPYSSVLKSDTSFLVIDNSYYITHNGDLYAFGLKENYYTRVASYGFDPQRITHVVQNRADNVLVRYLYPIDDTAGRRSTHKEKPPTVYLHEEAHGASPSSLPLKKATFHETLTSGDIEIFNLTITPRFNDKLGTIERVTIRDVHNTTVQIDCRANRWTFNRSGKKTHVHFTEGVPVLFDILKYNTHAELIYKYLPTTIEDRTHGISPKERALLSTLLRLFSGLSHATVRQQIQKSRRLFRALPRHPQRYTYLMLNNIRAVSRLVQHEYSAKEQMSSHFNTLGHLIDRYMRSLEKRVPHYTLFPGMLIELCDTPAGVLSLIKYGWNSDSTIAAHDQELSRSITDTESGESGEKREHFYENERRRLLKFLNRMGGAPEGAGAALENVAGAAAPPRVPTANPGLAKVGTAKRGGTRSGRLKILIPLIILILALPVVWFIGFGGEDFIRERLENIQRASTAEADSATTETDAGTETETDPTTNVNPDDTSESTDVDESAEITGVTERGEAELNGASGVDTQERAPSASGRRFSNVYQTMRSAIGNIEITISDIVQLTNRIAQSSGYRQLGESTERGPDPDLIYPRNNLTIPPDSEIHRIRERDTIWDTAVAEIEEQIRRLAPRVAEISAALNSRALTVKERENLLAELSNMESESYVAALTAAIVRIEKEILSSINDN